MSHADPHGPIEQHMYIQWVQIVVDHVEDPNEYCFGTQGKVVEFYNFFLTRDTLMAMFGTLVSNSLGQAGGVVPDFTSFTSCALKRLPTGMHV